ncbi:MAG: glycosyltransferase family 4 protein [Chitinophagaceae bacterium]|nr:glycosyltransferase family 4 protein [Chitinophagaceae bacterium]
MRRIVFDCERMKYSNTGLYHYCLNLGQHIQQKLGNSQEEQITFFSPSETRQAFGDDAPYIAQHSLQKFFMPSLREYDIWHCTYQNSYYVPKRNRKIKVVLTIHDLNFLYEDKTESRKNRYLEHLQHNINRSDAIVCISDFCRKDVLQFCKTGNKPVHVILNGANNLSAPDLMSSSYKPKRPFLFSLGVICPKKNFHVLLPLLKLNRHLELLIAGRTNDREYLKFIYSAARKLRVDENLRMLGCISEGEKSWYYRNCYAFALPSVAEGFGLPVAEAMSVGKPVFLSNRTALPEVGSNMAFYFQDFSETHMQRVFTKGMQTYRDNKMEQAIVKHSENFNWDKAVEQYLAVYRSLY